MIARLASHAIRGVRHVLLGALVVAVTSSSAMAQLSDPVAGVGVRFESYSFGTPDKVDLEKVSLMTVPVSAIVSLAHRVELGVSSAYASGKLTRASGASTSLSGLTDTEIRLTYAMANDRVRLSAVALAPTGKSKLTAGQMDVTGIIAADLLPFAISNWGSGGGLGINAAMAVPMNEATSVGLSAGYVVARKYEPLNATAFAYRPGNQLHVRAGADRLIGTTAKASLQLTYQHFSQDQSAGTNFYQSGDRLQGVGSYAFAAGARGTGIVYAGYLQRREGQYTSVVQLTPAQNLVYAGTGFRQQMAGVVLTPTIDVRLLGSDDGVEQGRTVSAGVGAEVPMGAFELMPLVRARVGHLTVRTAQESGFTGFEVGLGIRNRSVSR
ncbi:MAG: hypothetical protein ABIP93_18960 [Gemmatimonadaceae bacterium]